MSAFINAKSPIWDDLPYDNVVSHVYWNGVNLIDSKGNISWVQNGTVPVSSPSQEGLPATAGVFSDANNYSGTAASDPLDSTGDRFGAVAFIAPGSGSYAMFNNGAYAAIAGYGFAVEAGPVFRYYQWDGASKSATAPVTLVQNEVYVATFWQSGTGIFSRINLSGLGQGTIGTAIAGTAVVPTIGRYTSNGFSFPGKIIEIVQGLGTPVGRNYLDWSTKMVRDFYDRTGKANAWIG